MADLYNSTWRNVFRKAPTLSQERVLEVFAEMDVILREAIGALVAVPSVISDIMDLNAEVIGSLHHGRGIFERAAVEKDPQEAKVKRTEKHRAHWQADPAELYRYRSKPDLDAIAFMEYSIRMYAAWRAGRLEPFHLYQLQMSRASYEILIERFLARSRGYDQLCIQQAQLRLEFENENDHGRASELILQITDLSERMWSIELEVGCGRDDLYSIRRDVVAAWQRYKKLSDKIYVPYLRVVFDEARKRATSEIQTLENFQNGSMGLMRAISNYNKERGVFSSYARQWAMQGILLELKEQANFIKLPAAVWQASNKLNEIVQKLANKSPDGSVEMSDVAREAGIDERRVEKIFERVRSTQTLSIDYRSGDSGDDDEGPSLHDTIEAEVPDDVPFIEQYVDRIPPRQRICVFLHFGMFDRLPGNLPTSECDVARERVRQVVAETVVNKSTAD